MASKKKKYSKIPFSSSMKKAMMKSNKEDNSKRAKKLRNEIFK